MLSKLFWLLFVIVFVFVVWKDAPSMVEKHAQVEVPNPVMDMRSQLRVWMGMDSEITAAAEVNKLRGILRLEPRSGLGGDE